MAAKKRGLGKNLNVLLSSTPSKPAKIDLDDTVIESKPKSKPKAEKAQPTDGLLSLDFKKITPNPYQPRLEMDQEKLQELADSIKAQGLIQPIIVRQKGEGKYELIAGERRFRAAQLAGLKTIPCVLRDIDERTSMAMALIENMQREDLNPLEEANGLQRLIDEYELTQLECAKAVGKSRSTVANLLRLLSLAPGVKRLLECGDIEMGHARALLSLNPSQQIDIAEGIVAKGLTVRETEGLVRKVLNAKPAPMIDLNINANVERYQQRFYSALQLPVAIQQNPKGRGRLTVKYKNEAELEAILAKLEG